MTFLNPVSTWHLQTSQRLQLPLLSLGIFLSITSPAIAGGLFLSSHGVRPLGRAGAFTAGGDDPGVIWHNPAAISGLNGWQALLDGSIILLHQDIHQVYLPSCEISSPRKALAKND